MSKRHKERRRDVNLFVEQNFIKEGSHGRVYRVTLAGNHFGLDSGTKTICARKEQRIRDLATSKAEFEYSKLVSESKASDGV